MPHRLNYPATARNRDPILAVLKRFLPDRGRVLEIASGSGEHVVHFAQHYPGLVWQPSDLDPACLKSIQGWVDHHALENILPPLSLDTTIEDNWPQNELDALICINMVHISPWEATTGLMKKAGQLIGQDGFLYLYGPYRQNGEHTAPSNIEFEYWLKEKDPRFAVRDISEVDAEARKNGLALQEVVEMPANNFSLVFQRQ
ncbi:DUF938 domain-containing protein [Terasakiella sp.]|uniref:DUF938 domain-containing protein n=1 Tax=Terasakiella sp. TaxID=2034861 RepID=UPI003AA96B7B